MGVCCKRVGGVDCIDIVWEVIGPSAGLVEYAYEGMKTRKISSGSGRKAAWLLDADLVQMNEPQVHPVLCDHSLGSMFMGYHKAETPIHSHNATSIDGEMSNLLGLHAGKLM